MAFISYLITMFAVMFWGFRVVVAVTASLNIDIGFMPEDLTVEIIILFVTLACLALVVRRKLVGAVCYFITYAWYFGMDLFKAISTIANGQTLGSMEMLKVFVSMLAIILALATIVDIGINKNRKGSTSDKKTDWFYKNDQFDRKLDERADKNNYRIN